MSPAARRTFEVLVVFAAGAAVGAISYPSRRVEERERVIAELRSDRIRLEQRATELEARTRERITIVESPDGTKQTKIVRKRDESRSERTALEQTERVAERVAVAREKVTEVNRRRFGLLVGLRTSGAYFLAADTDLVGPVFFGVQADSRGAFAAGLGLRF